MERRYNRELKNKNRMKTFRNLLLFLLIFVLIFIFVIYPSFTLKTNVYRIINPKLPSNFDGYKIMQISDLYLNPNSKLSQIKGAIDKSKPDIIVLTGNIFVEEDEGYYQNFQEFKDEIDDGIMVYFTKGESELGLSKEYSNQLFKNLQKKGVYLLDDKLVRLNNAGQTINIYGFTGDSADYSMANDSVKKSTELNLDKEEFNLVLSHNPSYVAGFSVDNADLVLSGARNGGWIRLPFAEGMDYHVESRYKEDDYLIGKSCVLIVSRGAGTKSGKTRILNQREVVEIILKR